MSVFKLKDRPVHLGLGATATIQDPFTGSMEWYQAYGERNGADGVEGRLVSLHTMSGSWDTWEMHPKGAELVVCVSGRITLHQEIDGEVTTAVLEAGDAIINPPGTWHTADIEGEATAFFVTAGMGTEMRPRE